MSQKLRFVVRSRPQLRHPGKPEGFIRDPAAPPSKRPYRADARGMIGGFHRKAAGSRIGALFERLSGMTDIWDETFDEMGVR
jgi:hypothetical protein